MVFICIAILIFNDIFIFAEKKSDAEDQVNGYEDGLQWGEITGYIYGQKDQLNSKKSNWENAYKNEKSKVVSDYNLDTKSYNYRYKFLDGFEEGFQLGYKMVYEKFTDYKKETMEQLGKRHGEFFGGLMGVKYARNDLHNNKKSDWKRDMPLDSIIINEYNLSNNPKGYSDAFADGYRESYEEEYQLVYSNLNYDRERVSKEDALVHGMYQGETAGLAQAMTDYIHGKSNDWKRALYEFEVEKNLIIRYSLDRENSQYTLGFINGFREGFMKGYNINYQQFNMDMGERNINYKKVSMLEDTIEFEDEFVNVVNGIGRTEKRTTAKLYIPPGAIYTDTYITLQKEEVPKESHDKRYTPVTKIYNISITNDTGKVRLQKPLDFSLEYFASSRGGIYELVDNKWRYIYSEIDDGIITAEFASKDYYGGSYIVMIDESYAEIRDISTHWARKELYTFLRRGYIKGDNENRYRPNEKLTRIELLLLLSKVQNWDLGKTRGVINKFKDCDTFAGYTDIINYAVNKGYMKGYKDGSFRPNQPISYNEIEAIIRKITGNSTFTWDKIAEDIMYEKYTRSQSRFGKDNHITRAEGVYLLHRLQELKRI